MILAMVLAFAMSSQLAVDSDGSSSDELGRCSVKSSTIDTLYRGEFKQGGLIRGETYPGTKLFLDDKEISVDAKGRFIVGFGRDHISTTTLRFEDPECGAREIEWTVASRTYNISRVEGIEQKYIEPPAEVLERIKQEGAVKWTARNKNSKSEGFVADFAWPLTGRISGVYGSQRYYNGVPKRPHFGVDVAAPTGTYFRAPAPGVITLSDDDMYYEGGLIFLDHGMGLVSAFLHLSGVDVEVGDVVTTGDILGRVGAAGRANGPHLDWRMYWTDQRLDPTLLVGPMPVETEELTEEDVE